MQPTPTAWACPSTPSRTISTASTPQSTARRRAGGEADAHGRLRAEVGGLAGWVIDETGHMPETYTARSRLHGSTGRHGPSSSWPIACGRSRPTCAVKRRSSFEPEAAEEVKEDDKEEKGFSMWESISAQVKGRSRPTILHGNTRPRPADRHRVIEADPGGQEETEV